MGKGLAIVLGGPKAAAPPPPDSEAEVESAGPSKEEVAAFKELQAAMKSGDASTGAMALKNFLRECGY